MQRAYGLQVPQSLEEVCDPRRLGLIVYDMSAVVSGNLAMVPSRTVAIVLRPATRSAVDRPVFVATAPHIALPAANPP